MAPRYLRKLMQPQRVGILVDTIDRALRDHPEFNLLGLDGELLPFPKRSFHLVLATTVFSSTLDRDMALQVAREMTRVLSLAVESPST